MVPSVWTTETGLRYQPARHAKPAHESLETRIGLAWSEQEL